MTQLALIGRGVWGMNYIRTIRSLPWCELPDANVKTRDYRSLLTRRDIDGVIIATPASTHFGIAQEFLARGFHTLIEKPLATSVTDAKALTQLAKKSSRSTKSDINT